METRGPVTVQAGEALEAKRRVKLDAAASLTAVFPTVVYADAGEGYIGITEYSCASGDKLTINPITGPGTKEVEVVIASAIAIATVLYGGDDGVMTDTSSGSAQGIAMKAPSADNAHIPVMCWSVLSTTAATVSIADSGLFTLAATVEAALAEIYQHIISVQAHIDLPIAAWTEQDGTVLADFADATGTTPGIHAGDEAFGIRWNNDAAPDPIATSVNIPNDLDASADVIVHVLAAKTGATGGDAVTWLIEAFNNADGAAYDADADFGGTSSAMTGAATAKTCQEETLTLASANVAAAPCVLNLTLQPTDGTLGTDDVIVLGVWLEYTRKALTS